MIQRKQSLWLLIAALLGAGVLYFDLYTYTTNTATGNVAGSLRVSNDYPSLLIALLMTIVPLITIFLFSNRKRQINLTLVSMLANVAFIVVLLMRVSALAKLPVPPTGGSYWIGAVLPVVALVFLFLAISGIRKDDKLVKSVDRLR